MKIIVTFQSKRYSVEFTNDLDSKIKLFKQRAQRAAEKEFKMCLDSLSMDHPDENGYEPVVSRKPSAVIAPEPVTRRRRQEPAPEPKPEPEQEPVSVPAPQAPYVRKAAISDSGVISKTPLFVDYDWENKLVRDPSTDKFYDLNQYESVGDPEHDMDHIYWYDYSTNKFAFKTYNA